MNNIYPKITENETLNWIEFLNGEAALVIDEISKIYLLYDSNITTMRENLFNCYQ